VFLNASRVAARLSQQQQTSILEIGLGTGLNFLLTADLALKHGTLLDYTAFEFDPVTTTQFNDLGYPSLLNSPEPCVMVQQALNTATTTVEIQNGLIRLTVQKTDVIGVTLQNQAYDAVYLDAFSPSTNSDCWTRDMLQRYFTALKNGGRLSTYSSQGSVRRALLATGFDVEKLPGPPGKREFLVATRPQTD